MPVDPAVAKALFLEIAALDDRDARSALLSERCGADAELRSRIEALLAANDRAVAHQGTASFFDSETSTKLAPSAAPPEGTDSREVAGLPTTSDWSSGDEHAGAVIAGKYTLIEVIGEGGMGSVWRAKQTEPVKRFVAVKLIKAGMDSKQVLARFDAERQALALMDHPNIAKVLDGGVHEHRPYFVMELVKGVPITDYCDARKLPPKERLELFVSVCQAIQHAHQKGIIHRDIKPSNVLIALYDDKPMVKVIDFGVAKATGASLTEHTIDTGFGGVVGTPQYMSPEQATFNNLDIDTRSDVYALGVLLYELLTGTPPFTKKELEKKGLMEILRVVREVEPPRPSTKLSTADALPTLSANRSTEPKKLTGLLRNELDWIVMKALEKDRSRRYETANGFAADVLRYLGGEAVQAHPPSRVYRLKKFARRNRGQVIAATLIVLVLLGGIAGTTFGLFQAIDERDQKEAARRAESELRLKADAGWKEADAQSLVAKEESERNRRLRYAADVQLAYHVWQSEDGTASQVESLLRGQIPRSGEADHRDFAWRYQWGLLARHSKVFQPVRTGRGVASVDGQILSIDDLGVVSSWNLATGAANLDTALMALKTPTKVALSAVGIAAITVDDTVRLIDARSGNLLQTLPTKTASTDLRFSSDGQSIATVDDSGKVQVWDVNSSKKHSEFTPKWKHRHLVPSADGLSLLVSAGNGVVLYRAGTETPLLLDNPDDVGYYRYQCVLSPDGKLAATGNAGGDVDIWDRTTGKQVKQLRLRSATFRLAFSADSTRLAVGEKDGRVTAWLVGGWSRIATLKGHSTSIQSLTFTKDGRSILSLAANNEIRQWTLPDGDEALVIPARIGTVNRLSFAPDGATIAAAIAGNLLICNPKSGAIERKFASVDAWSLAFSPTGPLYAGSHGAKEFDSKSGKILRDFARPSSATAGIGTLVASTDGRYLAGGYGSQTDFVTNPPNPVAIWDATDGRLLHTFDVQSPVSGSAFSTNGLYAAVTHSGEVRIWETADWKPAGTWTRKSTQYASAAFLRDGSLLAAGRITGDIDLWEVATGRIVETLRGHADCVSGLAVSPDGRTMASSSWDGTVKLWDARTGRELRSLPGGNGWIYTVAFSADGTMLACGGLDGLIRVWHAPTPE